MPMQGGTCCLSCLRRECYVRRYTYQAGLRSLHFVSSVHLESGSEEVDFAPFDANVKICGLLIMKDSQRLKLGMLCLAQDGT